MPLSFQPLSNMMPMQPAAESKQDQPFAMSTDAFGLAADFGEKALDKFAEFGKDAVKDLRSTRNDVRGLMKMGLGSDFLKSMDEDLSGAIKFGKNLSSTAEEFAGHLGDVSNMLSFAGIADDAKEAYDSSKSTTTAGRLTDGAIAGASSFLAGKNPVAGLADWATGGAWKGLIHQGMDGIRALGSAATGDFDQLSNFSDKVQNREYGSGAAEVDGFFGAGAASLAALATGDENTIQSLNESFAHGDAEPR